MTMEFIALPTDRVRALQSGEADANGDTPEVHVSDGSGNPCRHCLRDIPAGERMLVLAYRPFPRAQPYAEVGPIFLCASECERHPDAGETPAMFLAREHMLVRAYGADDRIIYGSGRVVETARLEREIADLLDRDGTAYVHMRSATNNCYQCRIERS